MMAQLRQWLLTLAWWIVRIYTPPVTEDDIRDAVYQAGADVGLSGLSDQSDLLATGKLIAVLHHAALRVGKDHELRTVADVIAWLRDAPRTKEGPYA